MAIDPTRQETGQKILSIYKHHKSQAGHVLNSNNFLAAALNNRWDTRELQADLEFAVENGWIEKTPDGWLKLTETGYANM